MRIPLHCRWQTSTILVWGYAVTIAVIILLGVRLYVVHRALAKSEVQLFAAKQEVARLRLLEQAISTLESRYHELVRMLQQTTEENELSESTNHLSGSFLRDHEIIELPKQPEEEWHVDLDPDNQVHH